ncbi:MAG: AhpC/TSA family protein [Bacteroidales bacterium]|nr:AhpC/TSA family protein [Bacteroidales bacterium]
MRKTLLIPIYALITVFLLNACQHITSDPEHTLVVKGTVKSAKEGDKLKLQELGIKKIINIDSTRLAEDGSFKFITYLKHPNLYVLKLNKKHVTFVGSGGDTINFKAKRETFRRNYSISGNPSAELLKKYFDYTNKHRMKLDSLAKVFRASKEKENFYKIRKEIDSVYKSIVSDQKAFAENIIRSHPGTLAALYILNQRLYSFKLFREDEDYELFKLIDSALQKTQPQSKHAQDHHQRVQKMMQEQKEERIAKERLRKGAIAPQFALPNPEGDTIQLSGYKGHYVLLDFWAAWNAVSRRNNPQLVELYNKYKDEGFRILGVSLDQHRKMWEGAIEVDKLKFDHVSDLKHLKSPVAKLYNIDNLPKYFLIDPKGRIIGHNLSLKEVEQKVDSIYNSN